MARRHDPDDAPPWLGLVSHPGVIEAIAALYNHGPATFTSLRAYVELNGNGRRTAGALRRLAAWCMCRRRGSSGSWDEHVPAPSPEIIYELTDFGHRFAQAMIGWRTVVDQMPPELRHSLRQRH